MMKIFFTSLVSLLTIFSIALAPIAISHAAVNIDDAKTEVKKEACKNVKNCQSGNPLASVLRTVSNIMLFLVGAVAVIMLIMGGFRYVTSNGDQNAVTGAKNTILYAIIGIVVAFLAYAAVNFVVEQLTKGTAGS